ncbi:MAG: peptide chain release factor N(5)-glutamine methyltransferase [Deltaproteobacteria bacterium]|nr:peptide chain release factor N(5)-glutamine methyltransferase [Candidatus Zymogenaceae bacterium]
MISVMGTENTRAAGYGNIYRLPTLRNLISRVSQFLSLNGIQSHHLDARLIVTHALGLDPIDIYRKPNLPIDGKSESAVLSLMVRRASGVPTAYIIGIKEFWSLSITVDERVLIPRPETEILVEESLAAARSFTGDMTILELGTGSGAVSIALAMELVAARIVSTDISPSALSAAEANISIHGLQDRILFKRGDLFEAIEPDDRFDLIVSNPPYLTDEEMKCLPPEVGAEPEEALRGGENGLAVIERIVAAAPDYLTAGGFLIFEIGAGQQDAARKLIERTTGLSLPHTRRDYAGRPRVIITKRTCQ